MKADEASFDPGGAYKQHAGHAFQHLLVALRGLAGLGSEADVKAGIFEGRVWDGGL